MPEMNVNTECWPLMPAPQNRVNRIHAGPFIVALLAAPCVVAIFTFWMLLIPVFAIPFGLPLYLIVGIPGFMWALSYHNWSPWGFALLGFMMNALAGLAIDLLSYGPLAPLIDQDFLTFYFGFGALHAPAWAFAFAKLYDRFSNNN